jgi:hypothetical protein
MSLEIRGPFDEIAHVIFYVKAIGLRVPHLSGSCYPLNAFQVFQI